MSRLKHQLAGSRDIEPIEPCLQAPKELRLDMQAHLREAKKEEFEEETKRIIAGAT